MFQVFWPNSRPLRYADAEWEAKMWAAAIGGYYLEVDLGGPNWRNDADKAGPGRQVLLTIE